MASLVDLLSTTYGPIQLMLLPYLDVANVVTLVRTCKTLSVELPHVLKARRYDINRHLSRFFNDPKKFRSLQGTYGGLIRGAFARCFFSGNTSGVTCLEITMDRPEHLEAYLTEEGYKFLWPKRRYHVDPPLKGQRGSENLFVSFQEGPSDAICSIFNQSITTASLNILSWDKAYSLLPYETFINKECCILAGSPRNFQDRLAPELRSLTQAGLRSKITSWDRRCGPWVLERSDDFSDTDRFTRRRCVGDKRTWVYELDVTGIRPPEQPDGVLESTTFRLRWSRRQIEAFYTYNCMVSPTLVHPILKYKFNLLQERNTGGEKQIHFSYYSQRCYELKFRLDELATLELAKIPVDQRPAENLARLKRLCLEGKLALPSTWTYYDDKVIAFLRRIWEEQVEHDEKEEARVKVDQVAKIRDN